MAADDVPEEDEQVLGVLKRCEVCEEKTLHVGGVCQEHKIVRRKKRPAAAQAPARRPAPAPPPPPEKSWFGRIFSLLVLGGIVYLLGAVHLVHGDASGLKVCWKHGWSLSNTLVNSDEVAAKQPFPKSVLEALDVCY